MIYPLAFSCPCILVLLTVLITFTQICHPNSLCSAQPPLTLQILAQHHNTMSLPDNPPPPTNLEVPAPSIYPQGTYRAMSCTEDGKCQSGFASLDATGGTAFIADKENKVSELVDDQYKVKFLILKEGFLYLHGDPLEDRAEDNPPGRNRAQLPTIDILHWAAIRRGENQGQDEGDVETARSALSRGSRSVGMCSNCASSSCWCLPQHNGIPSCSPSSSSQDLVHSLVC
jgi:hypothetical protein